MITPILTENAIKVLEKRYLLRDENGNIIETPKGLFYRVAKGLAEVDVKYGKTEPEIEKTTLEFYNYMVNKDFMPNTPCLMNAGTEDPMCSACFVLPVGDSMEEIFDAIKWAALVHKRGGGTGFSFSRLRPRNSVVKSTSGVASGPVSFMKVFNAATEAVKQGGSRRGANMGILSIHHKDILEFIDCKTDITQVTNFNISVAITDEFMKAVIEKTPYNLYDSKDYPERKTVVGTLDANMVFEKIITNAWKTGEPGIMFIDSVNRGNPTHPSEYIEATNPCGEIGLPPYDSCNLLSLNLGNFVVNTNEYRKPFIDLEKLERATRSAIHFLDNVIDINKYPIEQIEKQTKKDRRLGFGIMGFADALVKLGIQYDSDKGVEFGDSIMGKIRHWARLASADLARERGNFPNYEGSIFKDGLVPMRNTTVTMIAPTGTISIIAGCSSGIEPFYAVAFTRNVMEGTRMTEVNPLFEEIAKKEGFYSEDLMRRIADKNSLKNFDEIPDRVKRLFRTAADVSPEWHVRMQAAFQKHCDSAVSKTINLPYEGTREDVKNAYLMAYRLGCKGITVYRDGSRPGQVLSTGETPAAARETDQVGAFGAFIAISDSMISEKDDLNDATLHSPRVDLHICPDCASEMIANGGCYTCNDCGVSSCSVS